MPRLRSRANLTAPSAPTASSTRPRRNTANQAPPAAVIQRSSPEESRQSIHLTVKASPGKLRKATGSAPTTAVSSRNIVSGKRASRNSRIVQEPDSDEEDEDDEPEEVDAMDVDNEEEDEDAEGDEDDDMDAEGEEDDEMELTPAPRIVVSNTKSAPVKPNMAQDSVEAKEMAMEEDDDEELSELDSEMEGEDEDAEGEDEDAEGEDDDELAGPDDEDMDSDEDASRDQTPDLSKMTRRQQAMVVQGADESLMALSNEAQKKKHLTAEEHAMRRAEMARRRKNLSEKRNEEEKMDTINRLLKKQPPKRGRKAIQEITESGQEDEPDVEKAHPLYVRYKQSSSGATLAVPEEWLHAPVGSLFAGTPAPASRRPFSGRMVEEVA
ncbi:hypothetical protein K458DRAFT_291409 [Lentithecium fluviatile CBS 122367]|uniref:INO80 complex subunit B-like conserved region domain-containing protein n=1 Tax=Lentithecium fluviatile CBS 122367 TaxID=1168545 RepID=A0A6G1JFQ0_9PLEO|nr:hypothetical protein K458DRAFT_291409 [Lentithecium fluviatile CBS 122367]